MTFDAAIAPVSLVAACLRTGGERLTFLRRRLGLTLSDAATGSGLSKSELSRLENGSRRLKDHHVEVLARLYGLQTGALRDLVAHMPDMETASAQQFLPCYAAEALEGKGPKRTEFRLARLPIVLSVSDRAYMIAVGEAADMPLPARSVAVIDPAARTVLGDLAANVATWSPPLIILRRDEEGSLNGSRTEASVRQFHKAVALFSESHFAVQEIAIPETR